MKRQFIVSFLRKGGVCLFVFVFMLLTLSSCIDDVSEVYNSNAQELMNSHSTAISGLTWTINASGANISIGQSQDSIERAIIESPESVSIVDFGDGGVFRATRTYETAGRFEISYNRNGDAVTFSTETADVTDFLGISIGDSYDDILYTLVSAFGINNVVRSPQRRARLSVYFDANGYVLEVGHTDQGRYYVLQYNFRNAETLSEMQINWQAGTRK